MSYGKWKFTVKGDEKVVEIFETFVRDMECRPKGAVLIRANGEYTLFADITPESPSIGMDLKDLINNAQYLQLSTYYEFNIHPFKPEKM